MLEKAINAPRVVDVGDRAQRRRDLERARPVVRKGRAKFPSGRGFRRAFVAVSSVLDVKNKVMWCRRTDGAAC